MEFKLTKKRGNILLVIILAFTFILAYTQSPLFTSNQNQYFLHGLARAGYGHLNEDWLANTAEPTPVFSLIIEKTYGIFGNWEIFYLFYPLLLAGYFVTILAIVPRITPLQQDFLSLILFSTSIIVIHSAGFRFALSRLLTSEWGYLLEDGIADQRLLGPVFQPSTFGVLLLISILFFIKRNPLWAVVFACLSAIFHPTYLLSAGSLVSAYLISTYKETRDTRYTILMCLLGVLLLSPILIYVYKHFSIIPAEKTLTAQRILVEIRLPHHALISEWFDLRAVIKTSLIIMGLYLTRKNRIFLILLIPFLVALFGSFLILAWHNNTLALIFPWRISTFLLPLSISIILAFIISKILSRYDRFFTKYQRIITYLCYGLLSLCAITGIIRMTIEFPQKYASSEASLFKYARNHDDHGTVYLIPIKMQDFRLATGVPVFVDYKSIPYRDEDVIEWYKRIRLTNQLYKKGECNALYEINQISDVDFIVIPADMQAFACSGMEVVYNDDNYSIYSYEEMP